MRLRTLKHVYPWHKSYFSGSASAIRQPGGIPTPTGVHLLGKEPTDSMCKRTQRRGKWGNTGRRLNHFSKAATAQNFQSPTNLHCYKSRHLSASAERCSSRPSSYMYCTEKGTNFPVSFDVCLGMSSDLVGSYETLVFQHSSHFLKHTS